MDLRDRRRRRRRRLRRPRCGAGARAAGADVVVLEARERVGGRTVNEAIGDGEVVEMGGQWVGPTQDRVVALAAELGVETFPTHTEGANLLGSTAGCAATGARSRGSARSRCSTSPAPCASSTGSRARSTPPRPGTSAAAARLDATSLADWIERTMLSGTAKRLMRVAGRTIWGAEPEELSLLHSPSTCARRAASSCSPTSRAAHSRIASSAARSCRDAGGGGARRSGAC